MRALATILALLALALAASAALNPWPPLLLVAVLLAVRAVEAIYAWAESRRSVSAVTPTEGSPFPLTGRATAPSASTVMATIQLRRGRLVLVRRRA